MYDSAARLRAKLLSIRLISPVRTFGSITRVPGGITRATAAETLATRAGSAMMSMRSRRPSLSKTSWAVAISTKTTLESMPGMDAGRTPATRSATARSPAKPRRMLPGTR